MTIKLVSPLDQFFVKNGAQLSTGIDGVSKTLLSLIDELHKPFAAGSAKDFVSNADLRGAIELLKTPDDLEEQLIGAFQLGPQFFGRVSETLEGLGRRSLACRDELIGTKAQLLDAVGEAVHPDPVLLGEIFKLLECLHIQTCTAGFIADQREARCHLPKTRRSSTQGRDAQCDRKTSRTREPRGATANFRSDVGEGSRSGLAGLVGIGSDAAQRIVEAARVGIDVSRDIGTRHRRSPSIFGTADGGALAVDAGEKRHVLTRDDRCWIEATGRTFHGESVFGERRCPERGRRPGKALGGCGDAKHHAQAICD
ncbi:hypothetical protein [Georhizobium sp. MAB10]|uniref:hypothetical protein n=1 Tax=Georhizobium sp. MAB10 TaxID=3028319 RepID=UPI0038558A26